jgi:hypothetical protein
MPVYGDGRQRRLQIAGAFNIVVAGDGNVSGTRTPLRAARESARCDVVGRTEIARGSFFDEQVVNVSAERTRVRGAIT